MTQGQEFRQLFRTASIMLGVGVLLVVACYFWVDRPMAFFVERHQTNKIAAFRWLTYPPPVVQTWSPLVLALLFVRRAFGPWSRWQKALFASLVSLIVADEFRTSLGDLCGRYWPETWFDNNPSLIGTGTYGFHPFRHGDDVGSFPSGHAARIVGFAGVWWIAMPRARLLLAIFCLPMLVSLVAMNYHFVGDVIAGSILGGVVAIVAAHLAGLRMRDEGTRAVH